MTVAVEIPMTLPSSSNLREHWAVKAKRVKAQRATTHLALLSQRVGHRIAVIPRNHGVAVTLTRVAPRKLDDDNLRGAFKAVRDEVAAYFGVDDADPRIEWVYKQAKGAASVRISFDVVAQREMA